METKEAIEFLKKRDRVFLYGGSTTYMSELNEAIDQVVNSSKRGEKYEQMWGELENFWYEESCTDYDWCVQVSMDKIKQKHFPKEE